MCKSILKGQNVPGTDGTYHGTNGTCPRDRRDAHQGVSRQNSLCLLVFSFPRLGLSGRTSGKTPETLSELFLEVRSRVRLGSPKPCNSRQWNLKAPEHFQNSLPPPPPRAARDASFLRSGSGEGLSEPVMEFPAVLWAYLIQGGGKGTCFTRKRADYCFKSTVSEERTH